MEREKLYTIGDLAKQLGVTTRTVRLYDEKGILNPCGYTEAGYRLYNESGLERLQKILMLRFLDFSLDQIHEMMQEDDVDIRASLALQEELLSEKQEHLERVRKAVVAAREVPDEELWKQLSQIVEVTKDRENVVQQYQKEDNLRKRISIHAYSTSKENYYQWVYDRLEFRAGMRVLDIGCGNAMFWSFVAAQLPNDMQIHLVDYSVNMLKSVERVVKEIQMKYPEKGLVFTIDQRDATDFTYPVREFDRIMANHMLYHMSKESRAGLYERIREYLKEDGWFSCTLVGKTHLRELHQFVREEYPSIEILMDRFDIYLESAESELSKWFRVQSCEEQQNDLLIPDIQAIYDYVCSYSKEAAELLSQKQDQFNSKLTKRLNEKGCFYIHKSTGMVICQ